MIVSPRPFQDGFDCFGMPANRQASGLAVFFAFVGSLLMNPMVVSLEPVGDVAAMQFPLIAAFVRVAKCFVPDHVGHPNLRARRKQTVESFRPDHGKKRQWRVVRDEDASLSHSGEKVDQFPPIRRFSTAAISAST